MVSKREVEGVRERVKSAHDELMKLAGLMGRGEGRTSVIVAEKIEEIVQRDLSGALEQIDYVASMAD